MHSFKESRFRQQLDAALREIRTVLDNERNPQAPEDVPHSYADKYILVEHATNTALAASLNALEVLGLTSESLSNLQEWATTRSVTLSLASEESCKFLKKATRTIEPTSERVHQYESSSGFKAKLSSKTVTKVTEWFWEYSVSFKIEAYKGPSSSKDRIVLREGTACCELVTTSDSTPKPEKKINSPCTLSLTWLLGNLGKDGVLSFSIDRSIKDCHTPRRNPDTERAYSFCKTVVVWANQITGFFSTVYLTQPNREKVAGRGSISAAGLFNPVVPLFEQQKSEKAAADKQLVGLPDDSKEDTPALPYHDTNRFLLHQKNCIQKKLAELEKVLPKDGLITLVSGCVTVMGTHLADLANNLIDAIDYVEKMIEKQVISAIGKTVSPSEFSEYMSFHYRKLFQDKFAPLPFSHAVRRPDHSPEGVISIEADDPVYTIFRHSEGAAPMQFPINAATNVTFGGDRYLHAYVCHTFSGSSGSTIRLAARARQFSCFILMVGRIASASVFEPKDAIIIQNKDDVLVPLLLEQIPTPKEFRDSIESLSPEQQRFAKAFRAMQLESTLFGVCVVQIKPQLEKLLNLPDDSLTKEIRLTQDLLELFIKYQIPSDLLSYDGEGPCSVAGKVTIVKEYVTAMYEIINEKKKTELKEKVQEAKYQRPLADIQQAPQRMSARGRGGGGGGGVVVFGGMPPSAPTGMSFSGYGAPPPPPACGGAPPARCAPMAAPPMAAPAPMAALPMAAPPPSVPVPSSAKASVSEPAVAPVDVEQRYGSDDSGDDERDGEDYTVIPAKLDRKFELLDEDAAVRPTIIKTSSPWAKTSLASLLAEPKKTTLSKGDLKREKDKAFDLLDALSKSGSLLVDHASLHVVMAATHCFDRTLLETVVMDNVNPIEKVERSALILATTIHDLPAEDLVRPGHLKSAKDASPALFSS